MTRGEYEQQYRDALATLKQRGQKIGHPYYSHDGMRVVKVGDFPCVDDLVFEMAWGKAIASAISAERPSPH